MKRKILSILVLAIIILVQVQIVSADEVETYKSATEYDYPPFSVTSSGEADGFSVELLKEVLKVMGLNATFKIDEWSILKEELKNGDIDILPLVGYTEDRDEVYDFTVPYIIMHGNIFIRNANDSIKTEEDLEGKQIIVMDGDNAHEYAVRLGYSENLILTKTYTEAFRLLESGKYDALLAQSLVGEQLLNDLNIKNIKAATSYTEGDITNIKINLTGFEQKFCFAVTEGNHELLAKLNEGLAIVSANGTFNELYIKWFPFLIDNQPTFLDSVKSSLIIIVPLIILLLIVSIIHTERRIKRKTKELKKSNDSILMMEAQMHNQQKLASIGVLASGVAHEINNPINGIMNYAQLILDSCPMTEETKEYKEYIEEIIHESNRIELIVKKLLQFSKRKVKIQSKANIEEIISDTLFLVKATIKKDMIDISFNIQKDLPELICNSQEIQQVLMNLITNARDALNEKYQEAANKKMIISAAKCKDSNKDTIRIIIEDNGNGIPQNIQGNIFDPFFTTKSRTDGTGLGLSISHGIIEEHGGELKFETEEGKYTRFIIYLPIS